MLFFALSLVLSACTAVDARLMQRERVQPNESLWSIGGQYVSQVPPVTRLQAMAAIYEANRGAFERSNMFLLIEGARLDIPPPRVMSAYPQAEAEALLASHEQSIQQLPGGQVAVAGQHIPPGQELESVVEAKQRLVNQISQLVSATKAQLVTEPAQPVTRAGPVKVVQTNSPEQSSEQSPEPVTVVVTGQVMDPVLEPVSVQANAGSDSEPEQPGVKLAPGDRILIQVYDEDSLTVETTIDDSGKIPYPLLGEVALAGLTPQQLQQRITSGLRDGEFLINPNVQVDVIEYRPFYIDGAVKTPGAYPFQPGLTAGKAIAIAQGITKTRSRVKIYLTRGSAPGEEPVKVDSETEIKPGDVISVKLGLF